MRGHASEKASMNAEHRKVVDSLHRKIASLEEEVQLGAKDREQELKSAAIHLERELRRLRVEEEEESRLAYAKLESEKQRQEADWDRLRCSMIDEKSRDLANLRETLTRDRDLIANTLSDKEKAWAQEREILLSNHHHEIAELCPINLRAKWPRPRRLSTEGSLKWRRRSAARLGHCGQI